MNKTVKRVLMVLLCLVLVVVLVVGGYVLYIVFQYSRIDDAVAMTVENPQQQKLPRDGEFSALTFNIGFGAYNHDFSFFMDSGTMEDGTEVTGKYARAQSAEIVETNMAGAIDTVLGVAPDFMLFQEVDVAADRSFKMDQAAELRSAFPEYASAYASNFHSAYLAWPLHEHHGAVEAGIMSFSSYAVDEGVRRSFPVDEGFPTKFFDLDRCFSILRLPVEHTDYQLVLINVHMSAYDEGGLIRAAQLKVLNEVMTAERGNGNWVVVGGDFNHALHGSEAVFDSRQKVPGWVSVFDENELAEGFYLVKADNADTVPTIRSTDIPYEEGVNFTAVLDGFIVSDNVKAEAVNVDADFLNSDHNPVLLTFSLE